MLYFIYESLDLVFYMITALYIIFILVIWMGKKIDTMTSIKAHFIIRLIINVIFVLKVIIGKCINKFIFQYIGILITWIWVAIVGFLELKEVKKTKSDMHNSKS